MKLKSIFILLVTFGLVATSLAKDETITQAAVVNQNSLTSHLSAKEWLDRISVGGVAEIVGAVGNHTPSGYYTDVGSSSDLFINNFNLLLNVDLNSWSKATFNLAYLGAPTPWGYVGGLGGSEKTRKIKHALVADEAYITLANSAKCPLYVTVGKKYLPFGDYSNPYVLYQIMSPAQMLAETNAVTAVIGGTTDFGLYGNLFAFRGESSPANSQKGAIRNFGGKVGYYDHLTAFNLPEARVNLTVGYLYNLWDSQAFGSNTENSWAWGGVNNGPPKSNYPDVDTGQRQDHASGVSAHVDFAYRDLTLYADWVGAVENMVKNAYATTSSKLWGANVNANYAFKTCGYNSSVGAGIQFAGNAKWLGSNTQTAVNGVTDWANMIPNWRLIGGYNFDLFKHTNLGLTLAYGKSFKFDGIQDARYSTLGLASLKFVF